MSDSTRESKAKVGVGLTSQGERAKETAKALAMGQLEAAISTKDLFLSLDPTHMDRILAILEVTRAASNTCCTGG